MKKILIALSLPLFIVSCYYDVEEKLYPEGCNTENVTYSNDVVPVLKNNGCISCHNASLSSGGVNLDGYENLKVQVDNGKFLSAISHDGNAAKMPQGGAKLPECTISKISAWIDNGAPND